MKVKTPFFIVEIEILFMVVFFLFLFSNKIKNLLFSYFICYLFIIFHEFSHILIATILGKEIEKLKLTISGVCVEFKREKYNLIEKNDKKNSIKNIFIYLAGPISNIILALLFKNEKMICEINIFLSIINLLPVFPLDGYNILNVFFELLLLEKQKKLKIFKFFMHLLYAILIIFGIIQFVTLKNMSIFIFFCYIFCLKKINEKSEKNV